MHPVKGHNEESRRRDRSKREEEHRKHRDGESLDRRHRDPDRDARREKEKQRDRVSTREGSKHREYRERNLDIKREDVKEDRYKEKRREQDRTSENSRHRDDDKEFVENRRERGETDERNRERRKEKERDRYKDKDRDIEMSKHRDRDTERDREKDKERERRRAERDKERKSESDRKKEERREERKNLDYPRTEERVRDKERERERERRERHKARESEYSRHEYEREGERRERHSDKEHSRHKEREHRRDREDREKRRRDKESHDADTRHSREAERERRHKERTESQDYHHGIKDDDRERGEAREREERDRRRDRRHKEASDSKRSDREQKHKESSSYERSERRKKDKMVENEETEDDKQSSKDYEEDFEDYEEDFEDVDEDDLGNEEEEKHDIRVKEEKRELSPRRREEIEAIQRAIDEENERIYSAKHSTQSTLTESAFPEREDRTDKGRSHGKIIDFVSAKQREISQKVAKKQKKRSEELLRLIDLDFSITFSLLDLPPVNEYDMYIKNFGTANTKQAYVQCNEDNTDRDIQTEEVDMMDKWTQHPPETKAACGGPKVSQETPDESMARMTIDSQRLTTFLRSATQVMAVLIEENMAESNSLRRLRSQTDAMSFSDGCLQLNTKLPFLHGRQVSLLQFSQAQRQTLLSVHPPSSNSSAVRLDNETIICVWNIWEPSRPQKILLYESEVRCCCFSPGKATLVFAGTAVGSVVVWDLREHSGAHCNLVVGKEEWTLRYPTFSTDAVLSGVGHFSPVVSIEPVLATAGATSSLIADIEESLGLSFQLGSLDENGVLTLWVVVELPKGNDSGSQTDLGLRPGGKVKLLHSSSLQTTERSSQDMGCGPPVSLQLKFLPSDSNHYFVGTNMGLVRHGTRHSLKVLPKFYRSQFDSCRPVEVTTLDFSPSEEPFFLVGCSDGTVRLHSVQREDPLMEWSEWSSDAPILSVQWSQTRPTVFCVLDAASDLHIWDLTEKDYAPVITENLHNDRVTAMAVFGDPAKQKTFSGVALAKQSGKVEIQYFKKSLTAPSPSDREKLQSVLEDAL